MQQHRPQMIYVRFILMMLVGTNFAIRLHRLPLKTSRCAYMYSMTNSFSTSDTMSCKTFYPTLDIMKFCSTDVFIVKAPAVDNFNFDNVVQDSRYNLDDDDILPEEIVFGRQKEKGNRSRLNKFLGGRIALRRSLNRLQRDLEIEKQTIGPILCNEWAAPLLPAGVSGSISHKDDVVVGAACWAADGRIGVDIERCTNKAAVALSRRILTENERQRLGRLPGVSLEEEVLLRFSYREAIYKAIHPHLQRSVDFTEVEVEPHEDGTATVTFQLKTGEQFDYQSFWQRYQKDYWLTCIKLTPRL